MKLLQWVGIFTILGLLSALSWGSNFIHVGDVRGLDIQVDFSGYENLDISNGEFLYGMGDSLVYTVRIKNRSNRSFSKIEVQSSLHSDGIQCESMELFPGSHLPGEAISPVYDVNLSPGDHYEYEAIYTPPKTLCPSSGNLKIRIFSVQSGHMESTTLLAPPHYQFK